MPTCAFCQTSAKKLSGEHIWDDWLNSALPKSKYRVKERLSPIAPFREYDAKLLKAKVPVVCKECNNGWMSDVTNEVKKRFSEAIIRGVPQSLSLEDSALLAVFSFMKGVVADHASTEYEPFFSRAARERFRQSLTVPPELRVWIAAFQGRQRYSGKCVAGIYTPNPPGPLQGLEFFSFSYVCGHLLIQTHAARWQHILHRGRRLPPPIRPGDGWNEAALQLWPWNGNPISWPPPKYIGDDLLQTFVDRFSRIRVQV